MAAVTSGVQTRSTQAGSQTLDRGLQVLEAVARSADPVSVAEAATEVGIDRRVAHRLIETLVARGYLHREGIRGYRLGPTCLSLASAISDLRSLAQPYLEQLAEQTGETAHLVVMSGRDVVFIAGIETQKALRVGNRTGRLLPAHSTSVGKAWLAALSTVRVDHLLGTGALLAVTDRTIIDPAEFRAELDMIRARGYAASHGESEDGVGSVAMAVRDGGGEPRLAMSVAMPLNRFTDKAHDEAVAHLQNAVHALTPRLSELALGL